MIEGEIDLRPIVYPFGSGGIVAGPRDGTSHVGEERDGAGVASGIATGIGIDAKQLQLAGLDPGLLQQFPAAGILYRLADLDETAG